MFKPKSIGIPKVNFFFLVLCLKKYIPISPPKEPPIRDRPKRVDSGILQRCFLDLFLSIPKDIKVIRFIMNI